MERSAIQSSVRQRKDMEPTPPLSVSVSRLCLRSPDSALLYPGYATEEPPHPSPLPRGERELWQKCEPNLISLQPLPTARVPDGFAGAVSFAPSRCSQSVDQSPPRTARAPR